MADFSGGEGDVVSPDQWEAISLWLRQHPRGPELLDAFALAAGNLPGGVAEQLAVLAGRADAPPALVTVEPSPGSRAPALGVYYKIINGTAVDGTDFNTPVTGEAIIPAGQWVGNALVIPLVNEGQFGTSKTFTVEITGTTSPITISPGTATATILGGTVPPDCSFTWISGSSQSMSCTERPATQVWNIQASCKSDMGPNLPEPGNQVTGDGTSTISSDCSDLFGGTFQIDSASSRGPQPVRAAGARAGCPPSSERWQAGLNRYGHNRKIRALMHCRSHPAGSGFVTIPRQNLMARPQTPPGALRGPGAGAHGCFARMSRRHRAGGAP